MKKESGDWFSRSNQKNDLPKSTFLKKEIETISPKRKKPKKKPKKNMEIIKTNLFRDKPSTQRKKKKIL